MPSKPSLPPAARGLASRACHLLSRAGIALACSAFLPVAGAQDSAASAELVIVAGVDVGGQAGRPSLPLRVIFVVDGSASMLKDEAGSTRWNAVAQRISADVLDLAGAGTPVEITVVKFGDRPSSVAAPGNSGWSGTLASSTDAPQVAADVIHRLGAPSGGTALFASMRDAIQALDRDLLSGRYSGGQVIVYSDGEDSSKTSPFGGYDGLKAATVEAVRDLRRRHPLSNVALRTFGEDARAVARELPELVDLSGKGLRVPPRVASLAFRDGIVPISPLGQPRTQRLAVRAEGLPPELSSAVSVSVRVGDNVLAGDLPFVADLALPASDTGLDVLVAASATGVPEARAIVRAPALVLPSDPREWGLPSCGSGWGLSRGVGEAIPLSVRLPEGQGTVLWSCRDDSGWNRTGTSAIHPGFPRPGSYRFGVEVRTKDGARSAELLVSVTDATLSVKGPSSANVGEPSVYRLESTSGAILSGARVSDVQWLVDGRPAGTGPELHAAFAQRGKALVSAEVPVSACGDQVRARGSMVVSVAPVPALEFGDVELVRGAGDLNRIPVRVMVASRVGAIKLTFNDGSPVRATVSQASSTDDAIVQVPVPPDAVSRDGRLAVRAIPEIRGDDGRIDSAASSRAAAGRDYTIRAPSPFVSIDEPVVGHEAPYEVPLPVRMHVEGSPADLGAARAIRVAMSGSPPEELPLGADGKGVLSVTPRFASGESDLVIRAVAIDRDGSPIGAEQVRTVKLRQPLLRLQASADQLHRDSKAPADLVVFVVSPEGGTGWEAAVTGTEWSVLPPGGCEVASETATKLVLRVAGTQEVEVRALVARAGGAASLGPVRVPVIVDPIRPDFRVTEFDSSRQVGTVIGERMLKVDDRTSGPVSRRRFEIRREGGDWEPIENPESFKFPTATSPGQRIAVRATYIAIDGAEVPGGTQEFLASPDHNWAMVAVAALACLGLSVGAGRICHGNEFLGASASWSADRLGTSLKQSVRIRWLRGINTCSVVSKRARLVLPAMYGAEDEFDWLDELRRQRIVLEMGGNLAKPRLTGGAQVAVSDSSRNGRVLMTTIQSTKEGAAPVYLSIDPSPVAAHLAWMSLTASLTVIWAIFAFVFLRGYI